PPRLSRDAPMSTRTESAPQATNSATIDDLYHVHGKAELIEGRIVTMSPAGVIHSLISGEIYASLRHHARQTGLGNAFPDNLGYRIPPLPHSRRESFSPDASYHLGPLPADRTRFVEGSPTFAVEVRSPDEYGPAAEVDLATKREDYF